MADVKPKLCVREAIRFANHDFLNDLQVLSMYAELGLHDKSKTYIQTVAKRLQMISNLNKLGLPETIEWLLTVSWRFTMFTCDVKSNVTAPMSGECDFALAQYLEKTMLQLVELADITKPQKLYIVVKTTDVDMQLEVNIQGLWQAPLVIERKNECFAVVIENSTVEHVKFQITANRE